VERKGLGKKPDGHSAARGNQRRAEGGDPDQKTETKRENTRKNGGTNGIKGPYLKRAKGGTGKKKRGVFCLWVFGKRKKCLMVELSGKAFSQKRGQKEKKRKGLTY